MCGRYLTPAEADFERGWKLHAPTAYRQSYNLAPSQVAPVLLAAGGHAPRLELFIWGFRPGWAQRAWINARAETVFESRTFAPAARTHRCLVPALGWYEWQGESPPRQPWLFHLDDFRPFAFAGIFCPAGADKQGSFAILTTAAPESLADIHGRMPVALGANEQHAWLDATLDEAGSARLLARNLKDFRTYRVSPHVNKPANNDVRCIAPL
jgi:putative SOS response-associated peptidase YedK